MITKNESIIGEGKLEEGDIVKAHYLHLKKNPFLFVMLAISLIAFSIVAVPLMFFCLIWYVFIFAFFQPFQAKRNFRQVRAMSESTRVETREDGLFFKKPDSETLIRWEDLKKIRNNDEMLLIYPARSMYIAIPSRFFTSQNDFESFNEAIKTRLDKTS